MKNRKGFTLVELLGVLVVLSVILMIAYPLITSYVKNTKQKAYNAQMEIMLSSLRNHANEYKEILPVNSGEYVTITLGQLKARGVVENSIVNPLNGKEIEDSMQFKITKDGTRYVYEVIENSVKTRDNKHHSPTIELTGSLLEYYDLNSTYKEKGVTAYDYNGNSLSVTTTNRTNMTENGIYVVEYSVTDSNGVSTYAYRTVIVGSVIPGTYALYADGTALYYNPVTGTACTQAEAVSTTGTKSGCMKWYAFLDNDSSPSLKLILDHNTTGYVAWNSNSNGTTPDTVNTQLQSDITNWNANVKSTARLISAIEINQMAPRTDGTAWNINTYGTGYYWHTGSETSYKGAKGTNVYAWLFDNTKGCTTYGCNIADSGTSGYWTSDYVASGYAWNVSYDGGLGGNKVHFTDYRGVRPVIEVDKTIFE